MTITTKHHRSVEAQLFNGVTTLQPSISIDTARRRSVVRSRRRSGPSKTKISLTVATDTALRLHTHAAMRGLEPGVAADQILGPWLVRYGAGRTAEEFRELSLVDQGPEQAPVAEQAA